ncbi:MAG: GGDEF domain-containing protein [Spirochaetes bacterium]|nr:GGDEF domain-containing protein [Spirochaetota bacterium]
MKSKTYAFIIAAICIAIATTGYLFIRPSFYEKEYIEHLNVKARDIIRYIEKFEPNNELNKKNFQKLFTETFQKRFPIEYLAIFDSRAGKIFSYSSDRESELFYSITHDIQEGKLQAAEKPLIRFYNQKKFYIFIKPLAGGMSAIGFRFEPTKKDIVRFILEIVLIVLLSIFFAAAIHLYRYRTGKIPAQAHLITPQKAKHSFIPDLAVKKTELSTHATNKLKEYVLELFTEISSEHAPDSLSIYLMNRESTHMSKTFEMKGKSFITIESPDLDIVQIHTELGKELQRSSVVVLSNGMRLLIPIMYRHTLLGAVSISRGVPFKGLEIQEIRASFGKLAQYLSEYIVYHDAVIDSKTGFYTNFYFNFKYEELLKGLSYGTHFSVLEMAFVKANLTTETATNIAKSISRKLFQTLPASAIPSLFNDTLAILLPNTEKESAIETAQKITTLLQGASVHIENGKVLLSPTIGIASTAIPGCAENPRAIAHENLQYALTSGNSSIAYESYRKT